MYKLGIKVFCANMAKIPEMPGGSEGPLGLEGPLGPEGPKAFKGPVML
jgi:hypothetical protein